MSQVVVVVVVVVVFVCSSSFLTFNLFLKKSNIAKAYNSTGTTPFNSRGWEFHTKSARVLLQLGFLEKEMNRTWKPAFLGFILVLGGCTMYMLVGDSHKPSFATTGKGETTQVIYVLAIDFTHISNVVVVV